MKKLIVIIALLIFITSCKKEPVEKNQPPVAIAGNDTIIRLPVDNIILNGTGSFDKDGQIKRYEWRQVKGPGPATFDNLSQAKTRAGDLVAGEYLFQLKVFDEHGLDAADTIIVRVNPHFAIIVNAGDDQKVPNTSMSATLDGTASNDPAGYQPVFEWRQISGYGSHIKDKQAGKTTVYFSNPGVYAYELTVRSIGGEGRDTTTITVFNAPECEVARTRVAVNAKSLKVLPEGIGEGGMVAVGNKLLFPAYNIDLRTFNGLLYIYDLVTAELTNTPMNKALLHGYGTAVTGDKIFFAGGNKYDEYGNVQGSTDLVQIYDLSSKTWTITQLSEARGSVATAVHGNKVYFAGGIRENGIFSRRVDIYDIFTGTWSNNDLKGEPRVIEKALTAENKIFFMGGYTKWEDPTGWGFIPTNPTSTIDIFNANTGLWETENMQAARLGFDAIAVSDNIYIAGGLIHKDGFELQSSVVEIIDASNYSRSNLCLSSSGERIRLLSKNDDLIFMNSDKNKIEIYNTLSRQWSTAESSLASALSMLTANKEIFLLTGIWGTEGKELFKLNF